MSDNVHEKLPWIVADGKPSPKRGERICTGSLGDRPRFARSRGDGFLKVAIGFVVPGHGVVECFQHLRHFAWGVVEPIRAPDPVEDPAATFEEGLPKSIAFSGHVAGVVGGAISFDSEYVSSRRSGVPCGKIDAVAAHSDLWIQLQASRLQPVAHIDFECVNGGAPARAAREFFSVARHESQEPVHQLEPGGIMTIVGNVVRGEASHKSEASLRPANGDVEPTLATLLQQGSPEVAELSVESFAVSHGQDDRVALVSLDAFDVFHKVRFGLVCAQCSEEFGIIVKCKFKCAFDPPLVRFSKGDDSDAFVRM